MLQDYGEELKATRELLEENGSSMEELEEYLQLGRLDATNVVSNLLFLLKSTAQCDFLFGAIHGLAL